MVLQLNTDKNIQGTEALEKHVNDRAEAILKHLTDKITRLEIHLSDQNAEKGGEDDILCKVEIRLQNVQPTLVTAKSESKEKAIDQALEKAKAALDKAIGKMQNY